MKNFADLTMSVENSPLYGRLTDWVMTHSQAEEKEQHYDVFRKKRDIYYHSLTDCYVKEAIRCFLAMKDNPDEVRFWSAGIQLSNHALYEYHPLTPHIFLGVLYVVVRLHESECADAIRLADMVISQLDDANPSACSEIEALIYHQAEENPYAYAYSEMKPQENNEEVDATQCKLKDYESSGIFSSALLDDEVNSHLFIQQLKQVALRVKAKRNMSWGHVMDAFIKMNLIDAHCVRANFAKAIAEICPELKAKNIEQSMKRYYAQSARNIDNTIKNNFISEIAETFKQVLG